MLRQPLLEIMSKKRKGLILHKIFTGEDFDTEIERVDLAEPDWNLQASVMTWDMDRSVEKHFHKEMNRTSFTSAAQEMWLVIKGSFEVELYDLDGDTLLARVTMFPYHVCFSFRGYHSIKALEDKSRFFEIKSGPYVGRDVLRISRADSNEKN